MRAEIEFVAPCDPLCSLLCLLVRAEGCWYMTQKADLGSTKRPDTHIRTHAHTHTHTHKHTHYHVYYQAFIFPVIKGCVSLGDYFHLPESQKDTASHYVQ